MERRRVVVGAATVMAAVLVAAGLAGTQVAGATTGTLSIDVAAMVFQEDSSQDGICGVFTPAPSREFNGTVGGIGTYIASVNLAQGAHITNLRLSARDNDGDFETHAYLLRKRMAPQTGLDGFQGFKVMASVDSNGSSTDLRRFSTSSINSPTVDNATFSYFVELVNCVDTVDAIGVQVSFTKP
jgi:hypothetical protein